MRSEQGAVYYLDILPYVPEGSVGTTTEPVPGQTVLIQPGTGAFDGAVKVLIRRTSDVYPGVLCLSSRDLFAAAWLTCDESAGNQASLDVESRE